mmetsp:Transcript_28119/g.81456  ORF Transcript_28119/g.81456 Transcript_28119/m.81456 type:complete len:114 (+) Transcript_28119:104-445(+)
MLARSWLLAMMVPLVMLRWLGACAAPDGTQPDKAPPDSESSSGKVSTSGFFQENCARKHPGTYCVGPVVFPIIFPLKHTILHCPGGTRETCPGGMYCGESTGDPYDRARCRLM